MNWYMEVLRKYAVFSGRARRKEYWMFTLFNIIVYIVLAIIDSAAGLQLGDSPYGILTAIYGLAVLIPSLAVAVRRLHDTGRSAWWLLIGLIPLINLILLVLMVLDSEPVDNEYGPNPKQLY